MQALQSVTPLDITPQNVGATARRKPLGKRRDSRPLPTGNELGGKAMDTDEMLAVLRGDIQGVNQRIDDFRSDVNRRLDELSKDLRATKTEFTQRLDNLHQRRLQGGSLIAAIVATAAVVGTFLLQLYALL